MNEYRRVALWRIIKMMLLMLLLAFVYILLSGSGVNAPHDGQQSTDEQELAIFDNINNSETVFRLYKGQRVWITRVSEAQRDQFVNLNTHVAATGGCLISADFCVLAANTDRAGINLSFVKSEPPQLPSDIPWVGGFVNPASGAVFDLWGRAYRFSAVASLKVIVPK